MGTPPSPPTPAPLWHVTDSLLPLRNPMDDVQAALVGTLKELLEDDDPDLYVCPVFDYVPEDAPAPYVVFNSAWMASRNALRTPITRLWLQIDVWSTYRGYAEANRISDQVINRLDHALILAEGWKTIEIFYEQGHTLRDSDGLHRRVALTFHSPYVSPYFEP